MAAGEPAPSRRPPKPYEGFPLTGHASGRFCKKIKGRIFYFGRAGGTWEEALAEYNEVAADLHAGRVPRPKTDAMTVQLSLNLFLDERHIRVQSGELTQRTFDDYRKTAERLVAAFGANRLLSDLSHQDFVEYRSTYVKRWNLVTLASEISRVRVAFNFAWQAGLIDRPVQYGPSFKRPAKKSLRLHRQKQGKRFLDAKQIRTLLDSATVPLRAMILLGVNAGLGNSDCGKLKFSHLDLDGGWLDYPRGKTGVQRRVPLWPETVDALRAAIAQRRSPKLPEHDPYVFITWRRKTWINEKGGDCPIGKEFSKLLKLHEIQVPGSFYVLRHVCETIAGETRDQVAVNAIMGHEAPTMASEYRESISDERLRRVTDFVRAWLFEGVGNEEA